MPGMKFPAFSVAYLKAVLTGFFVRITGDTMTGTLTINNPTGTGLQAIIISQETPQATARFNAFLAGVSGPTNEFRKARGTRTSPTIVAQGDVVFDMIGYGYDGTTYRQSSIDRTIIATATPSATDMQGRRSLYVSGPGSITPTEVLRVEADNGLSLFGANIFIDANRVFRNRLFTVATLPAGVQGMRTVVTDALGPAFNAAVVGGGAVTVPVFYTGAAWNVG